MPDENLSWKEKYEAVKHVALFRPIFTATLVLFSSFVALLEGIGLGFIHPILEVAQHGAPEAGESRVLDLFLSVYQVLDIPFSLGYLIIGVSAIMTFRFTSSFLVQWLKAVLATQYEKYLRRRTFESALNGEVSYFDEEGSENILNAVITETKYSGKAITQGVESMEKLFLVLMYLGVMFYISPMLTVVAIVFLGGITFLLRYVLEPAVTVGNRVAESNQEVQQKVQAGTEGIRDVKLFGMSERLYNEFLPSLHQYTESTIDLERNQQAVNKFYQLSAALTLFGLIYIGFTFTPLTLGALGIFLIAMFQLAPRISGLNSKLYKLEGYLAHLVRTQEFIQELEKRQENKEGELIEQLREIEFKNVEFSYNKKEKVLDDISFEIKKGEFTAFVGKSGAGKSTIVSLITQMYQPDKGELLGNQKNIQDYNLDEWRERIAVVRQKPYIFNTTLIENIKIGNTNASKEKIEEVCRISKVDEFLDELPQGLNTELGDDGVRLSGGQRQRVALARALLKDADLLILDEATSNLDTNLEKQVQKNIEEMGSNYGIIAIAHRLSTVKNADTIHTMKNGEITETGTHQQLMKKDGKYAELYQTQSKESLNE